MKRFDALTPRQSHGLATVLWAVAAAVVLFFMVMFLRPHGRIDRGILGDYRFYFWAADAMRHDEDPYQASHFGDRHGYIYPPLVAFLYMPLTHLYSGNEATISELAKMKPAAKICFLINLAILSAAVVLLAAAALKAVGAPRKAVVLALVVVLSTALAFDKIRGELQMFQMDVYLLLAVAIALYTLIDRPWVAGFAVGAAFNIKPYLMGVLLWLILRRRWKALGGAAVGFACFALLPATYLGLNQDLQYLGKAYGGVARLIGVDMGPNVADVEDIRSGVSISVTSAVARIADDMGIASSALYLAGLLGLACVAVVAAMYRRNKVSLLTGADSPLLTAAEFCAVLCATLVFSPQTSTRHALMTLSLTSLGITMALFTNIKWLRAIIAIALVAMTLGLSLPFRSANDASVPDPIAQAMTRQAEGFAFADPPATTRTDASQSYARSQNQWHDRGGPMWCVLLTTILVLWVALCDTRMAADAKAPNLG